MAEFTSTSGSYTTTLTVNQTSQDVASNTSVLTYSLTLVKNSGYGLWNNNSCPWSITINGTTVSGTFTYDFRNYSSLTLKGNTTISVPHNSDGTKSVSVSASVNMDNTPYVYTMSPSGTLTLTTIPRASTPSVANSYSIANTTDSLSYSITSQANFYHIVYWGIGDWVDEVRVGNINTTTRSFTIPNTSLLAKMSTTTSATLTITVSTYSDSAYNSFVASSTVYSTITVNTSYIKPSVSLGNIVINSTPITGYAVAGYASLRDTFSTTNSSGANGVTTYFSISTGSLQTTSTTSTSGTIYTNTVPQNNSNYTITIYAYAKDSRGATSDTVSKAITVYGYQPPTATLKAYRTTSSSSTNEDGAGTYVYVTFSGAVRSTVNSQNTVQSVTCTYSGSISGTATSGAHYALADNQAVTFTLTVTDKVTSSTAVVNITSAIYPLDLVDDGNGHVGGGFATLAEINKFKFGLPVEVNGAVTATQFNGNATSATSATSATTATNANNVKVTNTNPTSGTSYYIPFHSGASTGNKALCTNNGLYYTTLEGTTSATGYSILSVGNSVQKGTAGNKVGRLQIYGQYNHRVDLYSTAQLSANRYQYLPDGNGTLALHDVQLWTGSLTGTNSIDLDISAYKRIRIYAQYATTQQMIWEVDVTKLHATTQYRANHCELSWLDSAWYHTIFETFISKARFTLSNVYNMNTSGTTYAQNNSTAYQIYRIDGIL